MKSVIIFFVGVRVIACTYSQGYIAGFKSIFLNRWQCRCCKYATESLINFLHRMQHKHRTLVNPLTSNDPYRGRTAPLTSKRCILYIYSTNIDTEYFKHGVYALRLFFSSKCCLFHNFNVFGSFIIPILHTGGAKIKKKIIPAPKG
jgi:hypothetical protein